MGQPAVYPADTNLSPEQVRLQILIALQALLAAGGGGGGDATAANQATQITAEQAILAKLPAVGTSRTPACTAAVASASTSAGVKSVTFLASSDFSGTVLGQAFPASATLTFDAPNGDTLGAMAFTRAAGTLFIYYIP
jgi:hypothetical protein